MFIILLFPFLLFLSCDSSRQRNLHRNQENSEGLKAIDSNKTSAEAQILLDKDATVDKLAEGFKRKYSENNKDLWGQGVLSRIKNNLAERINLPDSSINIYKKPNGKKYGELKRNSGENTYYNVYLSFTTNQADIKVDIRDLIEIHYEGTCLKYYDKQDGYILCLINNYVGGIWIKIEELEKLGFRPMNWLTFLTSIDRCFYPLKATTMALYNADGLFIDSLTRGKQVIKLTKESKNEYQQVVLQRPNECGGCSGNQIGSGYIKAIDENGHPLIWYYTRGC